jgi:very-short-patch-repair endonuclease
MLTRRSADPTFARALRSRMTNTEQRLWNELGNRKLRGFKFRRQFPLGGYVVDFVCVDRALAIEVDGGQHSEATRYEQQRREWLELHGWRVLRFWNNDVHDNLAGVLERVLEALESVGPSPHPNPLPQAGEGKLGGKLRASG